MRKKFLSLILAMCMVMSLLPMTAFALGESDVSGAPEISNGTWSGETYSISLDANTDAKAIEVLAAISTDNWNLYDNSYTEVNENDAPDVTYTPASGSNTPASLSLTFTEADANDTIYYVEVTGQDSTKSYVKVTVKKYTAPSATVTVNVASDGSLPYEATTIPVKVAIDAGNDGSLNGNVTVTATATKNQTTVNLTGSATYTANGSPFSVDLTDKSGGKLNVAGDWTLTVSDVSVGSTKIDSVTAEDLKVTVAEQQSQGTPLLKTYFQDIEAVTYNGTAHTPAPAISSAGTDAGLETTDYDVTYSANTNAGTATAKVTAKADSDFSGSVDLTFTINKATLTADMLNVTPPTGLKYGDTINIKPTLKSPYTGAGDFTVKYYQDATEKTAPLDAGTYTFKITAKAGDNFEAVTTAFEDDAWQFEIGKAEITGVTISSDTTPGAAVEDGAELTATVEPTGADVTYQWYDKNDQPIDKATAASYTLSGATNGDSFTVKVTGTGSNYEGTATSNAIVVGSTNLDSNWIQAIAGGAYNGKPQEPDVVVKKDNETTLVKDTDYTVTYSDNINAGTATVTVIGMGSYTGTATKTFEITQANVSVSEEAVSVAVGATKTVTVTTDGEVHAESANSDKVTVSVSGQTVTITGVAATEEGAPVNVTISAGAGTNYAALANKTIAVTVTASGSAENPGGPGGSGGSSGGTTTPTDPTDPTTPTDPNPPSSGEDVTQTVTPEINEGSASATVDQETADKIVSDAVDNNSENVTVKVDVPADADVNEVKADIPASAVADLASKTNANLTVETPVANVTLPNETLSQLGGASGNVTVTATVNEDNSVKVEVQSNGSTVGNLSGGMKVDLPVSQPTAGTVAVLVDENGNETILPKSAVDGSEMAVLLETGSATIKFVDNAQSFADTDSHWAKNSIAFVSSRNLFQGMENNNFKADVPMNRAMLVTVLHRLESTPAAAGSSFDDVPSDSYYATAAAWAAGKGIVTGDASGFSGDRNVTREEMAVMLYRYVQTINGNKGTLGSFSNMGGASDVSGWATEAMRWAVGSGIISGDNSGNLNPGSTATRGEVSQMLMNFVKLITK